MDQYEDNTIKGLYYVSNYLTDGEQKEIMEYLKKSKKWVPLNKNVSSSRKVIHFGYNYAYDRSGIKKIEDIPSYFKKLVDLDRINANIEKSLVVNEYDQLIINEYTAGQGIYPHVDHVKQFGDVIVCITVGSGIGMEFIKNDDSTKKKTIYVQAGSMYIMSGDARYKWKHGIKKSKHDNGKKRGTRSSLTYRTVLMDDI
jgi:alkylated DNA repair dioxygenase AlkB